MAKGEERKLIKWGGMREEERRILFWVSREAFD